MPGPFSLQLFFTLCAHDVSARRLDHRRSGSADPAKGRRMDVLPAPPANKMILLAVLVGVDENVTMPTWITMMAAALGGGLMLVAVCRGKDT